MLTQKQILTYLQLDGIGRAMVFSLGDNAEKVNIALDGLTDMLEYIQMCLKHKIIKGYREKTYGVIDISTLTKAASKADSIIEKSLEDGIGIISYYDAQFPQQLKHVTDEKGKSANPLLIYYKGKLSAIPQYGIAIIGTREPTREGIIAGEFFAEKFTRKGFNIISGLALGCDSSAHRGALKGHGFTTAFLAHGLDMTYPKENEELAQNILEKGGLLISEYPIGTQPLASYFVERDRLQSGMANATLVVQTGVEGGTMHAVNSTVKANKPLYAVSYKGNVNSADKVQGNVRLINERKALPLSSSFDIDVVLNQIIQSIKI